MHGYRKRHQLVALCLAASLLAATEAPHATAATVITLGGVPTTRTARNVLNPQNKLRQALDDPTHFGSPGAVVPDTSFAYRTVGTDAGFTADDLIGVDAFVADFGYNSPDLDLSATEAQALHDLVLAGGHLVVYVGPGVNSVTNANELLSLFGITASRADLPGEGNGTVSRAFTTEPIPPLDGPFGRYTGGSWNGGTDPFYFYGKITGWGPDAVLVSRPDFGWTESLYIPADRLAPGAGSVFVWANDSHSTFLYASASAQDVNLNAFAALTNAIAVPEPGGALLLLASLVVRRRRTPCRTDDQRQTAAIASSRSSTR